MSYDGIFFPISTTNGDDSQCCRYSFQYVDPPGMPSEEVLVSVQWCDIFNIMLMLFFGTSITVMYEYIKEKKKGVNQK